VVQLLFSITALQSISVDESVLFDNFYLPVVTPLFFIETLGDLEKSVRKGPSAEEVVGIIAAKTPVMSGAPNVHHLRLVQHELSGHVIKMDHRPVVGEARRVVTADQRGIALTYEKQSRVCPNLDTSYSRCRLRSGWWRGVVYKSE
jgi:hypothetical protein